MTVDGSIHAVIDPTKRNDAKQLVALLLVIFEENVLVGWREVNNRADQVTCFWELHGIQTKLSIFDADDELLRATQYSKKRVVDLEESDWFMALVVEFDLNFSAVVVEVDVSVHEANHYQFLHH